MSHTHLTWSEWKRRVARVPTVGLALDASRMRVTDEVMARLAAPFAAAFDAMEALERGAIANPDEQRRVGHYWLRAPALAPDAETRAAIEETLARVLAFAKDVHEGRVAPTSGGKFERVLVIGIGGSALGPQLVADALSRPDAPLSVSFLDNTDPDGFDRVVAAIGGELAKTLTVVISKSGGTKETRNGMLEIAAAYERAGLAFGPHAVAVTGEGSALDEHAVAHRFVARFPMWDWVGGRTSELSAVGLVPAALQGLDVAGLLEGARLADEVTRVRDVTANPAALLAAGWHVATEGRGRRAMVVLPYKDRFQLLGRYLQQLVMESLGKARDLEGREVHQGIAVYGNKGSTNQHAYVQQLREGPDDFFAVFVRVLEARATPSMQVEPGVTSGDYLAGFLLGTRRAFDEVGRHSTTITVPDASARSLGAIIAVFERAVGLYASLVGINAYRRPGVEAGKRAAADVIALQKRIVAALSPHAHSAEAIAEKLGTDDVETVHAILEHLGANGAVAVEPGDAPWTARYRSA